MPHVLLLAAGAAALLLSAAACGEGDSEPIDAAPMSTPDASNGMQPTPDASAMLTPCQELCSCLEQYCAAPLGLNDLRDCVPECEELAVSVRTCRIEHCGYAANGTEHCYHAIGSRLDPNTPEACLE